MMPVVEVVGVVVGVGNRIHSFFLVCRVVNLKKKEEERLSVYGNERRYSVCVCCVVLAVKRKMFQ